MSDLNAATILADADIVDTAIMPIRKAGSAGLWKITLAKIKAYIIGTSFLVPPGGTTGQVLKKASGTDGDIGWGADNVGSGGSTTLNGLTDVSVASPTNGQVLTYDTASGKWKNAVSAGGGGALTKIAQTVVTVATNSVDFTGLPAGYEDLVIVINGQLSGSADFVVVRCNGDATSGNYQYARGVFQNSGLSYSSSAATGLVIGLMGGAAAGAAYADMVEASIQSYARTTFYKNARGRSTLRSGTTANAMTIEEAVADWLSTSAINRLTFLPNSGNFTVGTVFTIYGRG